jgi:MerR family transcriptional regulator, copper efflux regulator
MGRSHMRELTALTGVPERQVRYLIAEGFIPPPRGGRANADYGDDHVAAIRRYGKLRERGFPPAAIRLLLEARDGASFPVAPGVTLIVDPALIGSGTDIRPLVKRIADVLSELLGEQKETKHGRIPAQSPRMDARSSCESSRPLREPPR